MSKELDRIWNRLNAVKEVKTRPTKGGFACAIRGWEAGHITGVGVGETETDAVLDALRDYFKPESASEQ